MFVLSLFDGISCGQLALRKAGVSYSAYFASEIDKKAVSITQKNFPNTIQIGDVNDINWHDLPPIDLLIGGSPCQGFSLMGKQLGFEDHRSNLFYKFLEAKDILNPSFFLLENTPMKKESEDLISELLSVKPVLINSKHFVPQNRRRLYWTNIEIPEYERAEHFLHDVLDENPDSSLYIDHKIGTSIKGKRALNYVFSHIRDGSEIARCLTASATSITSAGTTIISDPDMRLRVLSAQECERLQGVPDDYTAGLSLSARKKALGNGWTVDVIAHIFSGLL